MHDLWRRYVTARGSTLVLIAVWTATLVVYFLIRPASAVRSGPTTRWTPNTPTVPATASFVAPTDSSAVPSPTRSAADPSPSTPPGPSASLTPSGSTSSRAVSRSPSTVSTSPVP